MEKLPRILIVDDEPLNIDYLEQELEDLGYDVLSARNGKEALELVESQLPDMILLDIMMDTPVDGFSLCHEIKTSRKDSESDIPVIFVSAVKDKFGSRYSFTGDETGMRGPDDYIDKPVKPEELLACIKKHLKK